MTESINLFQLFNAVTGALENKRESLNAADDYNQNHGDNMVQIFEVISKAMKAKQGADPADQLQYASELLRGASNSGSAQMYVRGLENASKEFTGKSFNIEKALPLIQMLMNGGEKAPAAKSSSSDMLSSLLSGLGGGSSSDKDDKLDLADLLGAGMAFMNAKDSGSNNLEALTKALVADTAMSKTSHRAQSGQVVANTVMQLLSSFGK